MLATYRRSREWVAIGGFALFALYIALEPMMASGDDCISAAEILILLPYYSLLYFGTLPALIVIAAWRIAFARRTSARTRGRLNIAIGALCALLFLEVIAVIDSPYTLLASQALDFVPAIVLAIWLTKKCAPELVDGSLDRRIAQ